MSSHQVLIHIIDCFYAGCPSLHIQSLILPLECSILCILVAKYLRDNTAKKTCKLHTVRTQNAPHEDQNHDLYAVNKHLATALSLNVFN